jgi:thiamine-phosphate pyrophosphorylase
LPSLPKLYAILDIDSLTARGFEPRVVLDVWLDAGVRLVQLRAKTLGSGAMLELADELLAMTRSAGATFIINDRADIALLVGADGVHVGQGDLSPAQVRDIAERDGRTEPLLVGVSTHDLDQIRDAMNGVADHLAIGPVFPTATKADADAAVGLAVVAEAARAAAGRPLVAIGGITLANAPSVLAAGATSVAVISDLLVGDPGRRAREYVAICQ